MRLTTCPTSEQLSHYLRGELSGGELDEIANHVGHCGDCDSAIAELEQSDDSLMRALRQPAAIDPGFEREAELQQALAAVRADYSAVDEPGTAGTILGNVREYDLLEKIGQGGMGTVYKALHSRLKRIVALKLLADHRLGDPAAVDRFSREMQAVGKLAHPNIVRALDAGEAEGRHYLVMEYIDGIDLSRLSRRCGPLPIAEACELVLQAALALQHAHEHNLVHRDMKPSNVMLTRDGQVKLLDLGIALLHPDEPATNDLTGTGQVMGTLDYMAPEQLDNTHAVDIRADVYGLGATLYKLLCGSAPATDSQSRFRLPGDQIPPVPNIRTIRGDVPKPVAAVLEKMLAPNPDQRYATPADVAEALKPFTAKSNLKQLSLAAASDTPPRPVPPNNRFGGRLGRFALAAMALLLFALAGFAIYVETDQGQIVIQSSVDDVQVLVKRTGQLYDALDELEVDKGDNQWKFRSGSYEVQLLGDTDGLRVKDGVFRLTRGGKAVVTVERMAAGGKKTAAVSVPIYDGKTFDEWIKLLKTDKSPQRQIEGIKALAALGKNGKTEVALETIFEIAASHSRDIRSGDDQLVTNGALLAIPRVEDPETVRAFTLQKLHANDAGMREFALSVLSRDLTANKILNGEDGNAFSQKTLTKLFELADDPAQRVRLQLIGVLSKFGKPAVSTLIQMYQKDQDENVRREAFEKLAYMGDKASDALHIFLSAVSSSDSRYRRFAVRALNSLKPDPKILNEALLKAFESEDVDVRRAAMQFVSASTRQFRDSSPPSTEFLPVIIAGLNDEDPITRSTASETLRKFQESPKEVTLALLAALDTANEQAKPALIEGMLDAHRSTAFGSGKAPVVDELINSYKNADAGRRVTIVQILGEIGRISRNPQAASTQIEKALKDKDPQVRAAAEKALESLNPKPRKPKPVMIQEEYAPKTKKTAAAPAPASSGPVYEGRTFAEWVAIMHSDDRSPQRHVSGINAMAALHSDANVEQAILAIMDVSEEHMGLSFDDDHRMVYEANVDALKEIGFDHAAPLLLAALESDDPVRRRYAATMLSWVKLTDEMIPKVLKVAQDPDEVVRQNITSSVSRAGEIGLKTLIDIVKQDSSPKVRIRAAKALGDFKEAAHPALPAILELYQSGDVHDRLSLLDSIKEIRIYDETIRRFLRQAAASDNKHIASKAQSAQRELSEHGWFRIPQPEEFGSEVYKGKTFDEWMTLLKTDKDPHHRHGAILALRSLTNEKNLDQFMEALIAVGGEHCGDNAHSGDKVARDAAIFSLIRRNREQFLPKLFAELASEQVATRRFATAALLQVENLRFEEERAGQILKLADDADEQVRLNSIELLFNSGEEGRAALVEMIKNDSSKTLRLQAAETLSKAKEEAATVIPTIIEMYQSSNVQDCRKLLTILGRIRVFNKEVETLLRQAAESEDAGLSFQAKLVLHNFGLGERPVYEKQPRQQTSLQERLRGTSRDAVTLTIHISADGKLKIGEKPYDLAALKTLLTEQINKSGVFRVTVHIDAASQTNAETIASVTNACRDAGVINILLGPARVTAPSKQNGGAVYDGKTFDEWVALLRTDRSAQRQLEGIKALAALRSEENRAAVVETIIKIAADENRIETARDHPKVADVAAAILKQIGPDPSGPALLAALQSENVQMRRFAASALEQFEVTEAMIPAILKLPADPDEKVRYLSTRLLRQAGEPGVDALAKMVENDESLSIRARAAASLGVLKQEAKQATPELLNALLSSDAQIRLSAISSLRHIKPDQKLLNDALLKFIAEDAPIVIDRRHYDPFELVDENSAETLPALIAGVVDDNEQIQRSAGRSLRNLKAEPEEVIPGLLEAAQDKAIKNKFELIKKIAHYHDEARAAMPALIKLYKTGDKNNRHILLYAFEKIDLEHKDVRPLLLEAAQSDDELLAKEAKKLLEVLAKRAEPVGLSIKITADGQFDVSGESYDWDGLKSFLAEQVKLAGPQGVQVRVDAAGNVSYATFSAVIELCKPLGVQISLPGKRLATPPVKNDQDAVSDDAK